MNSVVGPAFGKHATVKHEKIVIKFYLRDGLYYSVPGT